MALGVTGSAVVLGQGLTGRTGGQLVPLKPRLPVSPIVKANPKVIVLVHGATNDPATSGDPKPGTLDHAKTYWGYGLVSELVGAFFPRPETMVPNALGQLPVPSSAQLARRIKRVGGTPMGSSEWQTTSNSESSLSHHFYVAGNAPAATPPLSLLLTYRDASKHLVPQAKALIDQVYEKVSAMYPGGKVNLVFVGHSMGGLAARYVLTPSGPIAGVSLTTEQENRAKWIRDRTLYLTTLATPHEGSPLPAKFQGIRNFIQEKTSFIKGALTLIGFQNPDPVGYVTNVLGVTQALDHLRTDFWQTMNTGMLAPHKMARTDGTLIPVYVMGGRTPGGSFFDERDQYPTGGIKIDSTMDRDLKAIGLMLLDWGLRNAPGNPTSWGPLHTTSGFDLDFVERGNFKLELTGPKYVSPPDRVPVVNVEGLPYFYIRDRNDGETDNDGMVPIHSALGFRLGTSTNRFFDHGQTWNVGGRTVRGSWYRYNNGPWQRNNHDSICFNPKVGQWIFENLLPNAGPLPGSTSVSVWP
jgi:hypothetical protein